MINSNPSVKIALINKKKVSLELSGDFFFGETQKRITGLWTACIEQSKIFIESDKEVIVADSYAILNPIEKNKCEVKVSGNEKKTSGCIYRGTIELHQNDGLITILNEVEIEQFIQSILCIHFPYNSSLEFLKVEAILLRNGLLHLKQKMSAMLKNAIESHVSNFYTALQDFNEKSLFLEYKPSELLGLYRGMPLRCNQVAHKAVELTQGQVLLFNDELCETPQTVCCGGISEGEFIPEYSDSKEYLQRRCDSDHFTSIDITQTENLEEWFHHPIKCNCDQISDENYKSLISEERKGRTELFRWKLQVHDQYLSTLLQDKMGINLGVISNLEVIKRGTSGAISWLRIHAEEGGMDLKGQFLVQLKDMLRIQSLAFVIDKIENPKGGFTFNIKGVGSGFGAGVCQVGALNLAQSGKNAEEILEHYFPGVYLEKNY